MRAAVDLQHEPAVRHTVEWGQGDPRVKVVSALLLAGGHVQDLVVVFADRHQPLCAVQAQQQPGVRFLYVGHQRVSAGAGGDGQLVDEVESSW